MDLNAELFDEQTILDRLNTKLVYYLEPYYINHIEYAIWIPDKTEYSKGLKSERLEHNAIQNRNIFSFWFWMISFSNGQSAAKHSDFLAVILDRLISSPYCTLLVLMTWRPG